jgi:death-on-curing protein
VVFLSIELVEALQAEMIERYGGSHGLRDRGLLESAVARAENLAHYSPEASIGDVAATLGWGLIKNHAFIDGNKRVGFVALVAFLELNGHRLVSSEGEETAMVLRVAASEIAEEEWTAWVVRSVAAK